MPANNKRLLVDSDAVDFKVKYLSPTLRKSIIRPRKFFYPSSCFILFAPGKMLHLSAGRGKKYSLGMVIRLPFFLC